MQRFNKQARTIGLLKGHSCEVSHTLLHGRYSTGAG